METSQQHIYTLEEINRMRNEKLEEVRKSKNRVQDLSQELFAPQQSKNKIDSLMQHINTGIAAYDGVMTGIKVLHRIRSFFSKKQSAD